MTESHEGLSEREKEIVRLVATGASNKEIARQLTISTNTVKVHLRNIFGKIRVNSRTEAAMYAVNSGLLSTTEAHTDFTPEQPVIDGDKSQPAAQSRLTWYLMAIAGILTIFVLFFYNRNQERRNQQPVYTPAPVMEEQRWQVMALMPTARSGLALTVYENNVCAIGGKTTEDVTGAVECFDIPSNTWTTLASKPTPVQYASAVLIGGLIYVPGGQLASGEVTNVLEIYNPRQDTWSQGTALPMKVSAYAMVAYEGRLFLFGGWDGKKYLRSVFEYDPTLKTWRSLPDMPTARGFQGAAVAGQKIFVIGGFDGKKALVVNEIFLPDKADDPIKAWNKAAPLPEGTYAMGIASLTDRIFIIGGNSLTKKKFPSLVYIEPNDLWQAFDPPPVSLGTELGLVSQGINLHIVGGLVDNLPSAENLTYQALYTLSFPIIVR